MKRAAIAVLFLAGLLLCTEAQARTWYIKADGTGDAPTIQAGCDSATAGDSVLVGPGTHYVTQTPITIVSSGVTLVSQNGAEETIIRAAQAFQVDYFTMGDNSAIVGFWMKPETWFDCINATGSGTIISNNIIEVFRPSAIGIQLLQPGEVSHNLVMGDGIGIHIYAYPLDCYLHHNIILNGIDCESADVAYTECNDVLGDQSCVYLPTNFSLDPQFCGEGNYFLQSDSPCAPGNHPDGEQCGLIGPLPVGCGPVTVERRSWGQIKAIYRGGEE